MTIDFSFWLLLLTVISGVIWGIDVLFFKAARTHRKVAASASAGTPRHDPIIVDYARSFFPVLAIVFVVRAFLFEPFRIPSDSMMPGLLAGDFIFVSKFSYGLRLPVINSKVIATSDPKRGDVVVFRLPANPSVNYIKRLMGLPGDHVVVQNDRVTINGQTMPLQMDGTYNEHGYQDAQLATEDLGTVKHTVMFLPGYLPRDFDGVVPAGHYLFMGDNRDNSQDGRFPQVGFVPDENLVGHAELIWFHWKFSEMPIFSRIGTRIH
jgi:signal peptidase I